MKPRGLGAVQWVQIGVALFILMSVALGVLAASLPPKAAPPTPLEAGAPLLPPPPSPSPAILWAGQPTPTPLPSPTLPPASPSPTFCPPPQGWAEVPVGPGDTLEALAQRYHTTVEALRHANCLLGERLAPGSVVYVPPSPSPSPPSSSPTAPAPRCGPPSGWVIHVVQRGENLFRLSMAYGVSVAQLQQANCLRTTTIYAGQRLYVPHVLATNTPFDWTPSPTATLTPTPTATPPSPTLSPSPSPTSTPITPTPTRTLPPPTTPAPTTPAPTVTPTPTSTPSVTPTPTPTSG